MPENSDQPASWRAFTKPRRANRRNLWSSISVSEPKTSSSASLLSLPISPPTAALAPWPSRNFTDSAKPKYEGSKPVTPLPPSSSHSPSTATLSAPWSPITSSCAQEKCVPVNASAIWRSNQKKPARSTPPTTSASTATNPISSRSIPKPSSNKLSNSWPATATSKKAWAPWPLPGAGLPRSSLAPPSASLEKNSPIPPSSLRANSKPAKPPAPVSSLTQSPFWPTPRNLSRPSTDSDR